LYYYYCFVTRDTLQSSYNKFFYADIIFILGNFKVIFFTWIIYNQNHTWRIYVNIYMATPMAIYILLGFTLILYVSLSTMLWLFLLLYNVACIIKYCGVLLLGIFEGTPGFLFNYFILHFIGHITSLKDFCVILYIYLNYFCVII